MHLAKRSHESNSRLIIPYLSNALVLFGHERLLPKLLHSKEVKISLQITTVFALPSFPAFTRERAVVDSTRNAISLEEEIHTQLHSQIADFSSHASLPCCFWSIPLERNFILKRHSHNVTNL